MIRYPTPEWSYSIHLSSCWPSSSIPSPSEKGIGLATSLTLRSPRTALPTPAGRTWMSDRPDQGFHLPALMALAARYILLATTARWTVQVGVHFSGLSRLRTQCMEKRWKRESGRQGTMFGRKCDERRKPEAQVVMLLALRGWRRSEESRTESV